MDLNDFEVYRMAMDFGDTVYDLVMTYNDFGKRTIGIQLVPSADSVAANISEGFGRYFFKDKMRFYYFARGSLFESQTWIEKSFRRKYIDEKTYKELLIKIKNIGIKLNNTIDQVRQKSDVRS
jgi:four helix bundle protein